MVFQPMDFERVNVGCGRVSTDEQKSAFPTSALKAVGCKAVFDETSSGAKSKRPRLEQALNFMRPGDTLVVWKLDRLGRSMRRLIDTGSFSSRREWASAP